MRRNELMADPPLRPRLTTREQEVLDYLTQGFLYKEIAEALSISYAPGHVGLKTPLSLPRPSPTFAVRTNPVPLSFRP